MAKRNRASGCKSLANKQGSKAVYGAIERAKVLRRSSRAAPKLLRPQRCKNERKIKRCVIAWESLQGEQPWLGGSYCCIRRSPPP